MAVEGGVTNYKLYHGDCLDVLPTLKPQSIDAVIADPPYGTTHCKWDSVIPFHRMWSVIKHVLKPRVACVLFGSQPFTSALVMSNPSWFSHEWIWSKSNGGGFLNANRQPLKRHEIVSVFSEGQMLYNPQMTEGSPNACTSAGVGATTADLSVIGWRTVNNGKRYPTTIQSFSNDTGLHPTQKPVALLEYLIKTYTNEGDTVLDFTMGSGATGVAAANTGRKFIGVELDAEYFAIAEQRIKNAYGNYVMTDKEKSTPQPSLFGWQ